MQKVHEIVCDAIAEYGSVPGHCAALGLWTRCPAWVLEEAAPSLENRNQERHKPCPLSCKAHGDPEEEATSYYTGSTQSFTGRLQVPSSGRTADASIAGGAEPCSKMEKV